jgi:hypothetical protein
MPRWTQDKQHLFRLVALVAVAVAGFLAFRHFMVPEGFGALGGHYRAGALEDNRNRPRAYAGRAACIECHSDIDAQRVGSKHAAIGCEACHGPLAAHAANPDPPPPRPDVNTVCLVCHLAGSAKPAAFPQINPAEHMDGGRCGECHLPHHPERAPGESTNQESQG